jgi:FkbM family methyltransferase
MSLASLTPAELAPETEHFEQRLIRQFLEFIAPTPGYFVDVGANHPHDGSQTWHLEQRGWRGVLVEPVPGLAEQLRKARTSRVFNIACSSRENAGRMLPFHVAGALSALDRDRMAPGASLQSIIDVPVRTLDDILTEADAPQPLDFLSVDVEGHEIEVLRGLDFARWAPRLVLLEDHVGNLNRHRFMVAAGYRLVRRTGLNGWYVPTDAPIRFGLTEDLHLLRKYFLGLPFRVLRNRWRRLPAHYTA